MSRLMLVAAVVALSGAACSRPPEAIEIQPGSDVALETRQGTRVEGRLVDVRPDSILVESRDGTRVEVRRAEIRRLALDSPLEAAPRAPANGSPANGTRPPAAGSPARAAVAERAALDPDWDARPGTAARSSTGRASAPVPEYRQVTLPAGSTLALELMTAVGSDTSRVEDTVRATLRQPLVVNGIEAFPAGTTVTGHVTAAERPGRVKGRGRIAFRFTSITAPGDAERVPIRTDTIARTAAATKKEDATKIGGGAAGGAVIGGILGGGDGAAKGAAIGGAAGTGLVLSTRGDDVRLGPGATLSARLSEPVTVNVPASR